MRRLVALSGCMLLLAGCGAVPNPGPQCVPTLELRVTPTAATADHMATPPGNQVVFGAVEGDGIVAGCPINNVVRLARPIWTNPDPLDISISSAQDATNGTAVCLSSTSGPVRLTATDSTVNPALSAQVTLTCN
ncbi:MAG TPA: hypothetical protein VFC39_22090 [Acidobacteriaceae bacterium]|nr:hypothetical protein [Acidobacteriaceae bacterium]